LTEERLPNLKSDVPIVRASPLELDLTNIQQITKFGGIFFDKTKIGSGLVISMCKKYSDEVACRQNLGVYKGALKALEN